MYSRDHVPPHFHAEYGGRQAQVGIEPIEILRGRLPPRIRRLVIEWASIRQTELREAWNRTQRLEPTSKIAPLEQGDCI